MADVRLEALSAHFTMKRKYSRQEEKHKYGMKRKKRDNEKEWTINKEGGKG